MRFALIPTWLQEFEREANYIVKKLFHETTKNWFVHWINRHWTHERDEAGDFGFRSLMHIPIGMLMGIPVLGKPLRDIFVRYEENEDVHTKDQAWKDYNGAMIGEAITEVVSVALLIWFIVWLIRSL